MALQPLKGPTNAMIRWGWLVAAIVAFAALGYMLLQLSGVASSEEARQDVQQVMRELTLETLRAATEARESGDSEPLQALLARSALQIEAIRADAAAIAGGDAARQELERLLSQLTRVHEVALAYAQEEESRARLDEELRALGREASQLSETVSGSEVDAFDELRMLLAGSVAAEALAVVGGVGGLRVHRRRQAVRYERVRDALDQSEERYRRVLETMRSGILLSDAYGHLITVNGALCDLLGYTRDELSGTQLTALVHPAKQEDALARCLAVLRDEPVTNPFRCTMLKRDGSAIEVEASTSASCRTASRSACSSRSTT